MPLPSVASCGSYIILTTATWRHLCGTFSDSTTRALRFIGHYSNSMTLCWRYIRCYGLLLLRVTPMCVQSLLAVQGVSEPSPHVEKFCAEANSLTAIREYHGGCAPCTKAIGGEAGEGIGMPRAYPDLAPRLYPSRGIAEIYHFVSSAVASCIFNEKLASFRFTLCFVLDTLSIPGRQRF